jgi:hypothetical protein
MFRHLLNEPRGRPCIALSIARGAVRIRARARSADGIHAIARRRGRGCHGGGPRLRQMVAIRVIGPIGRHSRLGKRTQAIERIVPGCVSIAAEQRVAQAVDAKCIVISKFSSSPGPTSDEVLVRSTSETIAFSGPSEGRHRTRYYLQGAKVPSFVALKRGLYGLTIVVRVAWD